MNHNWGNGKRKKTNFRPDVGTFAQNLGPKTFFRKFYLYYMLDIVANYHAILRKGCVPNLGKYQKPNFGPSSSFTSS